MFTSVLPLDCEYKYINYVINIFFYCILVVKLISFIDILSFKRLCLMTLFIICYLNRSSVFYSFANRNVIILSLLIMLLLLQWDFYLVAARRRNAGKDLFLLACEIGLLMFNSLHCILNNKIYVIVPYFIVFVSINYNIRSV